jgi:hypothetical protein
MKKIVILSAATFITAATVNAQSDTASVKKDKAALEQQESVIKNEIKAETKVVKKLKGNEVSYRSKEAFIGDFGNIPVKRWKRTENFDKVTFAKDGKIMNAFYDFDAKLVGTTQYKTFAEIPANAQKFINTKYNDYSKEGVILFDDNELNTTDMFLYGTQFDDADNYFIELKKGNKEIILQVNMNGEVKFYKQLK